MTQFENIAAYLQTLGDKARGAANTLRLASADQRTNAINKMAEQVRLASTAIQTANTADMENARRKGLSSAMLGRLALDAGRIENMAAGLESVAALPDPVDKEDETVDTA